MAIRTMAGKVIKRVWATITGAMRCIIVMSAINMILINL